MLIWHQQKYVGLQLKDNQANIGFCEGRDPICIYIWEQCYLGKGGNRMLAKILSGCYVCFADGLLFSQ